MNKLNNIELIKFIQDKIKDFDNIYTPEYSKQIWLSTFRKNKIINLEEYLKEIDETIKWSINCIWIWIYEKYKKWNVLLYWTRSLEKRIEWNHFSVIFYKIKWNLEEINKDSEFLKRINDFIWKTSNTYILKYLDKWINYEDYELWKWVWRILWYFLNTILKKKIPQEKWRIRDYFELWKKSNPILYTDNINYIIDHYFWKEETIIPRITLTEKLKEKLKKVYEAKQTYEDYQQKYISEDEKIPEKKEEYIRHKIDSQYWDALSSALIEWYEENTENWKQAAENIFSLFQTYNWNEIFDIDLLENIQSNLLENLDKQKWIRDWEVFVIQKISENKINIKYAAPNSKDVYRMLNEYIWLLDYYLEKNTDPFVISIILSIYFVQIHPFFDWNWRTSRFLMVYILKRLWIVENYYDFQISKIIEENRQDYYNMLSNVWLPVSKDWKVIKNEYWETFNTYDSYSIYQNFNYESAFEYFFDLFEKVYYFQILDHQYFLRKKDFKDQIKEQIWEINEIQEEILKNISIEYLKNWLYKLNKKDIWEIELNFWNKSKIIFKILENLKEKYSKIIIPKLETSVFDKFKSLFK